MGASGSGKTTLLNVLSTIDTPTSGDIWISGINLKKPGKTDAADFRKDYMGVIFQEYFLLDSLTIRENISVPLTLQKLVYASNVGYAGDFGVCFYCDQPIMWYVFTRFILMFLFQGKEYRFKEAVHIILSAACVSTLSSLLISNRAFASMYSLQYLSNIICFLFVVFYHRKQANSSSS